MSVAQSARQAASALSEGEGLQEAAEQFSLNPGDFLAAREQGASVGTRIDQMTASLDEAGEIVNRSFSERSDSGEFINVISPVVIPKRRTFRTLLPVVLLIILGVVGLAVTSGLGTALLFFGPHYWVLVAVVAIFLWWRRSVVMVPEGCQALITKFGKLEQTVGPGRTTLLSPWKQVGYILNTTREYPFNAPIREAPTQSGVQASIDLFLQFRIEDPNEFIYVLGSVKGFSDKLHNAVSEVTRSLIYEQRAEDIYDLVGESTQAMLENLNQQFLPAVRLTNANITHAEPSSQEYRMDLASTEMVRVAKEAYTYEYELQLRKEQNEGDLNKELASLQETLSSIQAEIAGHQARMDTALERETNRAKSLARQRYVEAESAANANAALLEAQALDIRAVSAADAPEILEYRFQQDLLEKLEGIAERLPQVVQIGDGNGEGIDFLAIARQLVGSGEAALFSDGDMAAIRDRMEIIEARISERESEITELLESGGHDTEQPAETTQPAAGDEVEEKVAEIRQSVTDHSIAQEVEQLGDADAAGEVGGAGGVAGGQPGNAGGPGAAPTGGEF